MIRCTLLRYYRRARRQRPGAWPVIGDKPRKLGHAHGTDISRSSGPHWYRQIRYCQRRATSRKNTPISLSQIPTPPQSHHAVRRNKMPRLNCQPTTLLYLRFWARGLLDSYARASQLLAVQVRVAARTAADFAIFIYYALWRSRPARQPPLASRVPHCKIAPAKYGMEYVAVTYRRQVNILPWFAAIVLMDA